MENGSQEHFEFTGTLNILSHATVCLHPSVSSNNEKNSRETSLDKIAVQNSSNLDPACLKVFIGV